MTDQDECAEVCTSSCHASDCEHHGHLSAARVAAPSDDPRCDYDCDACAANDDDDETSVAAPSDGRRVTRVDVSDGRLSTSDLTNLSGTYYLVDGDALARAHWALVNWVHRTDEAYLDILDRLEPWVPHYEAEQADAAIAITEQREGLDAAIDIVRSYGESIRWVGGPGDAVSEVLHLLEAARTSSHPAR